MIALQGGVIPDSNVHGANVGPTHIGPMNLAIREGPQLQNGMNSPGRGTPKGVIVIRKAISQGFEVLAL